MEKKTVASLLESQKKDNFWEKSVISNAPLIVALFSNIVVVISDVRAYDVIYNLTQSWWKALAASFACAVPFIMWEIAWQYNHTTETWRKWSLVMAGAAFMTSIVLGVADFIPTADSNEVVAAWLLGGVVIATGIHTVVGFLYFYNDPDVARRRNKSQALAAMLDQELNAQVAENLLESGSTLLGILSQLESKYTPEEVAAVMRILCGEKQEKPTERKSKQFQPVRQFASEEPAPKSDGANRPRPDNSQKS